MGIAYQIVNSRGFLICGEVTLLRSQNPNPIASLLTIADNITSGRWREVVYRVLSPEVMNPVRVRREKGRITATIAH
jgi:hypothetical protein